MPQKMIIPPIHIPTISMVPILATVTLAIDTIITLCVCVYIYIFVCVCAWICIESPTHRPFRSWDFLGQLLAVSPNTLNL